MKAFLRQEMIEATRLTQAGRLTEATAVIQALLGGDPDAASEPTRRASITLPPPQLELKALNGNVSARAGPSAPTFPATGKMSFALKGLVLPNLPGRKAPSRSEIAPSAGQYISATISGAAGPHTYKLYIPSRLGGGPRPLIVMLHGCTQSADDFAAGTRMNFAAEGSGCFVLYPEQSLTANPQKCWNWFKPTDQQRGRGEPALIAAMTRHVMRSHPIDAGRVYVAGLSAGGAAAAIMGEAYPDLSRRSACTRVSPAALRAICRPRSPRCAVQGLPAPHPGQEPNRDTNDRLPRGSRQNGSSPKWGRGDCARQRRGALGKRLC